MGNTPKEEVSHHTTPLSQFFSTRITMALFSCFTKKSKSQKFVGLGTLCQELSLPVRQKIVEHHNIKRKTELLDEPRITPEMERRAALQRTICLERKRRYGGRNWLIALPKDSIMVE